MKNEPRPNPHPRSDLSAKAGEAGGPPASSLDEVRKRLQSYGYLNSRIEKFYVASFSRSASLFFNRFLLSLRVGVLAGSLAAILMTAGTVLFNVDLLRKKIDLALLFFYFELFFVLVFTAVEFGLIFLVSAWVRSASPRRLPTAGQVVSFLTGLAFFGYFLYWGRSQYEYLRLQSMVSLLAMFVVLTLSCIFVAKCVWLGFVVAFRETEVGHTLPDWKRHSLEVMLSVAAVIVLIPLLVQHKVADRNQPPIAVMTTPDRWIVIGVDGLSQELLTRFATEGVVPYISSLAPQSLVSRLEVTEPVVPPVTWTSIATGVSPAEHGILMPEVRRWGGLSSWMQMTPFELAMHSVLADVGFGQRQPVSGYMRKVKAFWEILSDNGIACGVVNWWGSWPARPQRGWNVSERYFYKRAAGAPPQEETFPADLFSRFAPPGGSTPTGPALDSFYMNIYRRQLHDSPVRVAALYLPGLDILNYEFYQRRTLDAFEYAEQYRAHLHELDDQIRSLSVENRGFHILILFHQGRSLTGQHSALLVNTGNHPMSVPGHGFDETEITPLLLHSCGLPIAKSMNPALITILDPGAVTRLVDSFPKKEEADNAHADEFNDLLVEQMKSLGYLQ